MARVLSGSMAAQAGICAGDTLTAIGATPLTTLADLPGAIGKISAAPRTRLAWRNHEQRPQHAEVAVVPLPTAAVPNSRTILGEVDCRDARLRTLVTCPETSGPHPALLFIPGISCASVDYWHDPTAPLGQLVHGLARAGMVTMRVDKRGVGDSEGGPAASVDFDTEVAGFAAALTALAEVDEVDNEAIFIFGHSVGGMIAPLLAAAHPLRGIAVYGSSPWRWQACMMASLRRQLELSGRRDAELEAQLALYADLYHAIFSAALSPARAAARAPALASCGDQCFGRTPSYLRQLEAADIADAWSRVDCPVLAIHGEYDWVASAAETARIVELVARDDPNAARHLELAGTDHLMREHADLVTSFADYGAGRFAEPLVSETLAWIRTRVTIPRRAP